MLQITSQLAGLGLNGNWSLYEKRLSIPGSASGVICNFGKSFLHLSFSFPHTHKESEINNWSLTVLYKDLRGSDINKSPDLIYWEWYTSSWGLAAETSKSTSSHWHCKDFCYIFILLLGYGQSLWLEVQKIAWSLLSSPQTLKKAAISQKSIR